MTTLGIMKARIKREIYRDDLDDAIAAEIDSAIKFYASKRLYFTETIDFGFDTVPGQDIYSALDLPEFGNLVSIDSVTVAQNGFLSRLRLASPEDLEVWSFPTPANGPPYYYSYYASTFRIYPKPADVYPLRILAVIPLGPPPDDNFDGNPWMYDAEELIRSRAKRNLYLHSLGNTQMGQVMKAAEDEAYDALVRETSSRTQIHEIRPWCM